MTEATLTLEQEIIALRSQLHKEQSDLAKVQHAISEITEAPHFRAKQIQELQEQLRKKRSNFDILQEQVTAYVGSDLQGTFEREVKQKLQEIKDYDKSIQEKREENERKNEADLEEKRKLQHTEQTLFRRVNTLNAKLQELESKQDAQRNEEGENAYRECVELYKAALKAKEDKDESQEQILDILAEWPELQSRFLDEYEVGVPETGVQKIARAAIACIDALIECSEDLHEVTIGGVPIEEILALTDVQVLAYRYEGGISNLQEKRAALLRIA